jgi:hypothetical protein
MKLYLAFQLACAFYRNDSTVKVAQITTAAPNGTFTASEQCWECAVGKKNTSK